VYILHAHSVTETIPELEARPTFIGKRGKSRTRIPQVPGNMFICIAADDLRERRAGGLSRAEDADPLISIVVLTEVSSQSPTTLVNSRWRWISPQRSATKKS